MRKNVLQLVGSFHLGGSERQAVQLTRMLKENGQHNIHLAALAKEGVLIEELSEAGFDAIPEFRLSNFYNLNFLNQLRRFRRYLVENQIDIIQTHDFYTNVFGMFAARLAGVGLKIAAKRETEGMRSDLQNRIEKLAFGIADVIVANSEGVKNYLISNGVKEEKIEVVYNGIDLERLQPRETNREAICDSLGLPTRKDLRFVTMIANLRHEVKNQEMLLRAARTVKEEYPDAHFVFAGEGERKDLLKKMALEFGVSETTHFIGRCESVPELLSISYVCVLTSFSEGFSNSILEYMAAGKPVIATDVGGASEAVDPGKTGYLVDSGDDETLAERLRELLLSRETAVSLGKAGRLKAEQNFTNNVQLQNTISLYRRLMEK